MAATPASLATQHHLYSQIRDTIRTGDLLAWRITKASSFFDFILILYQKLFKAKFSHVATAVRVGDRLFAVEAVPNMVRIAPLSMLGNFYLIRAGVQENRKHFGILTRHIGKKYSVWDLFKSAFRLKTDDTELYCSELVLAYLEEIGYFTDVVDEFDDRIPTPDDIVDRVLTQGKGQIEFVRIDKGNLHEL